MLMSSCWDKRQDDEALEREIRMLTQIPNEVERRSCSTSWKIIVGSIVHCCYGAFSRIRDRWHSIVQFLFKLWHPLIPP